MGCGGSKNKKATMTIKEDQSNQYRPRRETGGNFNDNSNTRSNRTTHISVHGQPSNENRNANRRTAPNPPIKQKSFKRADVVALQQAFDAKQEELQQQLRKNEKLTEDLKKSEDEHRREMSKTKNENDQLRKTIENLNKKMESQGKNLQQASMQEFEYKKERQSLERTIYEKITTIKKLEDTYENLRVLHESDKQNLVSLREKAKEDENKIKLLESRVSEQNEHKESVAPRPRTFGGGKLQISASRFAPKSPSMLAEVNHKIDGKQVLYNRTNSKIEESPFKIKDAENKILKDGNNIEYKKLKDENEQLRGENEKLRVEKEKFRGENEQLRGENEQLRSKKEPPSGEKEQLRSENEQLRGEKEQLRDENEKLKTDVEDLKKCLERQAKINELQESIPKTSPETNTDLKREVLSKEELQYEIESLKKIRIIQEDSKEYEKKIVEFSGTTKDKDFLHIEEMLIRNLVNLDNVESQNNPKIRQERKNVLQYAQKLLEDLKEKAIEP